MLRVRSLLRTGLLVGLLLAAGASLAADREGVDLSGRTLMGYVEKIVLLPEGLTLKARLDTGANTASLHADNIEEFERDGEHWVRFDFDHGGRDAVQIEAPIERRVRIARHSGKDQRRAVVNLPFCLNGQRHHAQFSLIDRDELTYPALLGRRFLRDVAVVDPAARYLTQPECPSTEPPAERTDEDAAP
ncbi:MAG: RimK/LysX family protein [Pseudomonadota bacterium]|nr:RimK/LysX family protein [Pseudomonadota bacterium]